MPKAESPVHKVTRPCMNEGPTPKRHMVSKSTWGKGMTIPSQSSNDPWPHIVNTQPQINQMGKGKGNPNGNGKGWSKGQGKGWNNNQGKGWTNGKGKGWDNGKGKGKGKGGRGPNLQGPTITPTMNTPGAAFKVPTMVQTNPPPITPRASANQIRRARRSPQGEWRWLEHRRRRDEVAEPAQPGNQAPPPPPPPSAPQPMAANPTNGVSIPTPFGPIQIIINLNQVVPSH